MNDKRADLEKRVEQALQRVPLNYRIDIAYMLIYAAWRCGNSAEEVTAFELARGAWLYHTFPLRKVWEQLKRDEGMQLSICGVLTVLFYVAIVLRSLGAR